MVNLVEAQKQLIRGLVRLAGLRPQTVELEPAGTSMTFWVPKKTKPANEIMPVGRSNNKKAKPVVVLVHGFAAEGIVTWLFQIRVLTKKYAVYVPDLLFFGGSTTGSSDKSPAFQAECLTTALDKLGVERCTVVGFSYGGMVAFKMAEARPDMVENLVVSGSVIAMNDDISGEALEKLGFSSSSELLLPESVKGLKALASVTMHKRIWFPDCVRRDYLKVMFNNRKERKELLEGLVISNKDAKVPKLRQRILLLWGENDNLFKLEHAQNMKEQLGEKATIQAIKKAGHLVHLERPCVYNRRLKEFLALIYAEGTKQ